MTRPGSPTTDPHPLPRHTQEPQGPVTWPLPLRLPLPPFLPGPQSAVGGPVASGGLIEMQVLRPRPRPSEPETGSGRPPALQAPPTPRML